MRFIVPAIFFISGILLYGSSHAQTKQNKLDSLLNLLPAYKEDTTKVLLLSAIAENAYQTDPMAGVGYGEQGLELATKLDYVYGILKTNNLIARCYAAQNNYPMALKHFQASLASARKLNNPAIEAAILTSLGAVYTGKNEFDKALQYLMQAKDAYEKAGVKNTVSLMINIGYLYMLQKKYPDAITYYMKGIAQEETKKTVTNELATLYSNIGGAYVQMQDYNNGLHYLFNALAAEQNMGNNRSAASTLNNIGEAYLSAAKATTALPDSLRNKNNNLKKAVYYLEQSLPLCHDLGLKEVLMLVYDNLSETYELQENYKQAFIYYDKYALLKDSLRDISKEKEFAKIEAEFYVSKKTDSLNYLNTLKDKELKRRKQERNGFVLLVGLTGIISLLLINRQKLKHQQKSKATEAETIRITELAAQQLNDFTKSIQEKNELIEKFTEEIEKYRTDNNQLPGNYDLLEEMKQAILLTDAQWVDFKNNFDKVYKGYVSRVKDKYPDITPAELRFFVLTKLQLSNKEMANMLGISAQAIRVMKHRLIKKLDLEDDSRLDELIMSI